MSGMTTMLYQDPGGNYLSPSQMSLSQPSLSPCQSRPAKRSAGFDISPATSYSPSVTPEALSAADCMFSTRVF